MLRRLEKLISKILALYCGNYYEINKDAISRVFRDIRSLVDARGIEWTVKYVKLTRLAVTRYMCGQPLDVLEGVKLNADGFPKWISHLQPLMTTIEGKRIVLTLLIQLRGFMFSPTLDITPIVTEWGGTDTVTESELRRALRQLGINQSLKPSWEKFHMSTKSGPQGQALTSSVSELTLLPQELIQSIIVLGGDKLGSIIEKLMTPLWGDLSLVKIWSTIFKPKSKVFRKLSYFSDKEGKTRQIAILDYWSQTALRPYHDAINGILRRVKTDCTFNQNSIFETLPTFGPYYSLDLTTATDRMPLALQLRVMSYLFGEEKARAWAHVLVGYGYTSKDLSEPVKYRAGQPMGAYSSWSAMALTHHVIVLVAAQRAGLPQFSAYCLLGDDLVIANARVAEEYIKLCSELDMPISLQKSHVSLDTFEFAKRWFVNGTEITGFSASGLNSVWKSYALLHNYLITQALHGWLLDINRHPELITSIYTIFGRPQQGERVVKLYMVFDAVPDKGTPHGNGAYALLSERIIHYFGEELISQLGSPVQQGDLESLGYCSLLAAKRVIAERDLGRFQKDASAISRKLNRYFKENFPGLSVRDYRAALGKASPLILVLNDMIIRSAEVLRTLYNTGVVFTHASGVYGGNVVALPASGEPVSDDTLLNMGLSKYFVSKGVFTMRAQHSIVLAKAQETKLIIDQFKLKLLMPVVDTTPSIPIEVFVSKPKLVIPVSTARVIYLPAPPN